MIYKAQPCAIEKIPDLVLNVTETFPESSKISLDEVGALHEAAAAELLAALTASLPGGTIDALLRGLLLRRASMLVVRPVST